MHVVLIAAMTADGKIAESEEQVSLDWTSKEDTEFFKQKTKELGVLIMGRKTFETIGRPLPGRLNLVMTREPSKYADKHQEGLLEFTSDTPEEILEQLTERGYASLALAGGASVYGRFLEEGLVNEMYLTVEPVMFGGGVPLAKGFDKVSMKLEDVSRLGESTVLLRYSL